MIKRCFILRASALLFLAFVVQAAAISPVAASSLSTTTLITTGVNGHGANDYIQTTTPNGTSNDGRISVFSSEASNLIPGDQNGMDDIFTYDRITKKTELVSYNTAGKPADYPSYNATVSGDGRYVAYTTLASDIMPRSDAFCEGESHCSNIIVYDRKTKTKVFANRTAQGKRIPIDLRTLSGDPPVISSNGRFVAYRSSAALTANDTNNDYDIFVHDLHAQTTRIASVDTNGHTAQYASADASISGDGRFVAFNSYSAFVPEDTNNTYDNYVHDMQTGKTSLLSAALDAKAGNGFSNTPMISNDGQWAVFTSYATNLVVNDRNNKADSFLRDLRTGKTRRVSVSSKGIPSNNHSYDPGVSSNGRFVIFSSGADNLVRNDTNDLYDIFLYDRDSGALRRVSVASHDGAPAVGGDHHIGSVPPAAISGDGKAIIFTSDAANLTPDTLTTFTENLYIHYNPVVSIPYYDNDDFLDLL